MIRIDHQHLIVFIVLLAVHKGHAPIRSVSRQIQTSPRKISTFALTQTVPIELEQLGTVV